MKEDNPSMDEEEKTKENEEKDKLIDELLNISQSKPERFSVRSIKKPNKKEETKKDDSELDDDSISGSHDLSALSESIRSVSKDEWQNMLNAFDELSPIDDITEEERTRYRRRSDGDKYDDMFKKELSMLNDVLSDIQQRSKIVRDKINYISGRTRDVKGVTKNYVDLISASSTLDTTRLNVIKELVNVKKTKSDLRMKESKLNPEENKEQDRDTVADMFYKSILNGSTKEFAKQSSAQYENMNMEVPESGFNITQPLPIDTYGDDYNGYSDKYGYIKNENRNVQVCLYRYPDDTLSFVALADDDTEVPDYELPDIDLLETMSIRPGASYAYDKFGRKYKILDVDNQPDDIISNEDFNDDDKYEFAANSEIEDEE